MGSHQEPWLLENGSIKGLSKEMKHGRTAHNMSASSLRKKSECTLVSKVRNGLLRNALANLQEVIFGTKLSVLFPAVPLAIVAQSHGFARQWVFALSLLGLTPLAERLSFLTEQIAFYTGPTVGGLLNATCGNATELILAIFALRQGKIDVVKFSLLGSILSNILLVLGTSLFCGGLSNLRNEQKYDRRQADVHSLMLLMALLCLLLPMLYAYVDASVAFSAEPVLQLSRATSIVMLLSYLAFLVFQLFTHRELFEAQEATVQEEEENDNVSEETAVIGVWSAVAWLVGMTGFIALLSEYAVETIEDTSESWGLSISFIGIILLPIVGNAAEHAGAIIFAVKNKLDITLGVALGSSVQIAMFVVPLCVVVSWIMGVKMDLNFNLLETGSLTLAIVMAALTLQDGTSHYMKGLILMLCYIVVGACFFVLRTPFKESNPINSPVPLVNEAA